MILIAVSGSSHTDWVFVEDGHIVDRERTEGVNPYFQTRKEISRSIRLGLDEEYFHRKLQKIYFYGAGCSDDDKKKTVTLSLVSQFRTPAIVESNLLAAARGICQEKPGIVCILDTGSNSCLYNGKTIVENVMPCGFILGDEGSGAAIGKAFLSDVLKKLAPKDLISVFYLKYKVTPTDIMKSVYNDHLPHYYLSSISTFLTDYQSSEYVHDLVASNFRSFLNRNLKQYDYMQYTVCFTGNIAIAYLPILKEVCREIGCSSILVEESVVTDLVAYHHARHDD